MGSSKKLGIYLQDDLRQKVEDGDHGFFNLLMDGFFGCGFEVDLYPDSERSLSEQRDGYSLFCQEPPSHDRALSLHSIGLLPFWHIEKAHQPLGYQVALKDFDPEQVDGAEARQFHRNWHKRMKRKIAANSDFESYILILLQDHLLGQQKGQSTSPMAMIDEVLTQDRFRQVVICLDPNVQYSAEQKDALTAIASNPRVQVVSGAPESYVPNCEYIVSESSDIALNGLLFNKPTVLFGEAAFHHICQNVGQVGATRAFRDILAKRTRYAKYFYWFLKLNALYPADQDMRKKVLETCRDLGWQV